MADSTSISGLRHLARTVMRLFEHWELDMRSRLALLGMGPEDGEVLDSLRRGAPLPKDLMGRVGLLLALDADLRLFLPQEPATWIHTPNPELGNRTPLEVMMTGLPGIKAVAKCVAPSAESLGI